MCVCESVCVREISGVNYSLEHVETHLSSNRKLQHKRKKREEKERLTKKMKGRTDREQ